MLSRVTVCRPIQLIVATIAEALQALADHITKTTGIKPAATPLDSSKPVFTIEEAADYLGISRGSVYRLLDTGKLGSAHVGSRRLIAKGELERFLTEETTREPEG